MANFIYKATRYEFWPWYLMYVPILPVYFYGVLKTRKLLYFTATNPSIDMGGFFGEHKDEILDLIPENYKAKGVFLKGKKSKEEFDSLIKTNNLYFPLVAKPNVGERGEGVRIVRSLDELVTYSEQETDYIVQEYIDYPLELGVLFYKYPNDSKGRVSSITLKAFLTVRGDGSSTVEQLLQNDKRGRIYLSMVKREFPKRLSVVPEKGEDFVVHRIGNHVKGTRFIDANEHISNMLNDTFSALSNQVSGVYYGRYDLKVPTFEDLEEGRNIKIFELNGVSSEPGHIYDQTTVFKAYSSLAHHWLALVAISHQNIKKGVKTTPLSIFFKKVLNHFFG